MLGNSVGADKEVSAPTEVFAKDDTIYASIATTGAGSATLMAKWSYRHQAARQRAAPPASSVRATRPATG